MSEAEELLTKLLEEQINAQIEEELIKPMRENLKNSVTDNSSKIIFHSEEKQPKKSIFHQTGEENGSYWEVVYDNGWLIRVKKGDIIKEENIGGYEPRFGVDYGDSMRIEETLDKMLKEI